MNSAAPYATRSRTCAEIAVPSMIVAMAADDTTPDGGGRSHPDRWWHRALNSFIISFEGAW